MTYIATGDLLRQHRADGTALGRQAAEYMADGRLVPDELVVSMIMERIARDPRGALLLDGFPRTLTQADRLAHAFAAHALELTAVLLIDTTDDVIEARICGWRQCSCGRVYHVEHDPPGRPGVCDEDGARLRQRDDDRPEIVRRRLAVYHETQRRSSSTTSGAGCFTGSTGRPRRPRLPARSGRPSTLPRRLRGCPHDRRVDRSSATSGRRARRRPPRSDPGDRA